MKRFLLTLLAFGFALGTPAEDGRADLQFPKTDIRDVLEYYGKIVKKPVFVANQVFATITIEEKNVAVKEIPEVIRKALLEKHGIAMRETKEGEVLVEWSSDPKYPRRSEEPQTATERKAAPRVRPIRSEGIPMAAESPFLPIVVLIVDESGLPLGDVPVRLEVLGAAEPVQPPDEAEKLLMERFAHPVRSDERGAAVLFYRGRVRSTMTNDALVYARPFSGSVVVDSPGFQRAAHPLTDVFGRTGLQPRNWAPFLKIVLKRSETKK